MMGKVGQGGAGMQNLSAHRPEAAAGGVDLNARGVEMEAGVRVGGPDSSSSTEPQFGKVWQNIQAQMGQKVEKPREAKKTLGKDDFLRLMIMQMKYQDPNKPFEMDKMGAEMAQLSSMEQLANLNQTMKQLATRDQPVERLAMTNMIGKTVTVDRDRFPHNEGTSHPLKFNLPMDAQQVVVTVLDQTGTPIFERDLGPQRKGEGSFLWDGKKANSISAKSGNYMYRITATDPSGNAVQVESTTTSRVVGVGFEGQKPVLLVGDLAKPEKVFMDSIVRVTESAGHSALIPGAQLLSSAQPAQAAPPSPSTGNFFTFTKGVGSAPLDAAKVSADDAKAIEQYQKQAQTQAQAQVKAEGFPNGLDSAGRE